VSDGWHGARETNGTADGWHGARLLADGWHGTRLSKAEQQECMLLACKLGDHDVLGKAVKRGAQVATLHPGGNPWANRWFL